LHQPEKRSGRGLQNFIYQARAQGVIELLLPTYPELRWLYDPEAIRRGESAFQQTIMQELGRIPDDALLVRRARDMCNLRPTSREAVKLLRRARLQHGAKGSVEELTEVLRSAVNNSPVVIWSGHIGSYEDHALLLGKYLRKNLVNRGTLG